MPLTTYEIRWFVRDQPFDPVAAFGVDTIPESRTDWYAPAAHPGTGTKLRSGRLETKLRTDTVEMVDFAGCQGSMERWQKWSSVLSENPPEEALLRASGWLPIQKERWMQVWSADRTELEVVTERVGRGALFELTRLGVGSDEWWTVALEAFGPEGERRPALERVMHHVLAHLPAHRRLAEFDSMGYPAWLLKLASP